MYICTSYPAKIERYDQVEVDLQRFSTAKPTLRNRASPQQTRTGLRSQVSTQSSIAAEKSHAEYNSAVVMHLAKNAHCKLKTSDADFSISAKARR